jgi:hypothetical protein
MSKQVVQINGSEVIENLLNEFDFQKVMKVMELLDWKWIGERPTLTQLRNTAQSLLEDVLYEGRRNDYKPWDMGTGGFVVEYRVYHGREHLGLAFNVTWKTTY